jgi:hypothetical protein
MTTTAAQRSDGEHPSSDAARGDTDRYAVRATGQLANLPDKLHGIYESWCLAVSRELAAVTRARHDRAPRRRVVLALSRVYGHALAWMTPPPSRRGNADDDVAMIDEFSDCLVAARGWHLYVLLYACTTALDALPPDGARWHINLARDKRRLRHAGVVYELWHDNGAGIVPLIAPVNRRDGRGHDSAARRGERPDGRRGIETR